MQELLEELSNVYDVSVTVVLKSGGGSSMDSYINATLWTVVFNDPVGDVPALEVQQPSQKKSLCIYNSFVYFHIEDLLILYLHRC